MDNSGISWCTHTWNAVTGCKAVSPGCDNCYAKTIAERYRGQKAFPVGFDIQLRPHKMNEPKRWKEPSFVFVNSMSDLFHKDIPEDYLVEMWSTMLEVDRHIYQCLTKRPHVMVEKINRLGLELPPHIWLGVSVENQTFADSRIPALLSLPAAVRWLSCEPLLGPVDLTPWIEDLQWVVVGGESGPGRRPMDYDWARSLRDQCQSAGTILYYKQGNHFQSGRDNLLDGVHYAEWPWRPGESSTSESGKGSEAGPAKAARPDVPQGPAQAALAI